MPDDASQFLLPFLEARREGLYARAFDAFLDPIVPVPRAILSHAHADHAVDGHALLWATPSTVALYRRRHPDWNGAAVELAYGEPWERDGARLRLVSAGHVLGSAQVRFETDRDSLLYTGDFKLRPARTVPPVESPPSAALVLETTFGLPVFRFPPREELERRIVAVCREAIAEGETPVLLAYALGKAQETAAILTEAGIPTVLHGAAWKLLPEYAAAGTALPLSRAYETGPPQAGEALITPPSTSRTPMVRAIRRRRVVYLSGWAIRDASRSELDADVLIPMSDHADFEDLRRHVRQVGADRVVTFHGFARDFARLLPGDGVAAAPLLEREERPPEDP